MAFWTSSAVFLFLEVTPLLLPQHSSNNFTGSPLMSPVKILTLHWFMVKTSAWVPTEFLMVSIGYFFRFAYILSSTKMGSSAACSSLAIIFLTTWPLIAEEEEEEDACAWVSVSLPLSSSSSSPSSPSPRTCSACLSVFRIDSTKPFLAFFFLLCIKNQKDSELVSRSNDFESIE